MTETVSGNRPSIESEITIDNHSGNHASIRRSLEILESASCVITINKNLLGAINRYINDACSN